MSVTALLMIGALHLVGVVHSKCYHWQLRSASGQASGSRTASREIPSVALPRTGSATERVGHRMGCGHIMGVAYHLQCLFLPTQLLLTLGVVT